MKASNRARGLCMAIALAGAAAVLALPGEAHAQASEIANPDAATEKRLKALAEELRCLVCQNQTIADSNAPLAVDLRNQIRGQIAQGRSDAQIRDYMVERYGDFVLYRPPFHATTVLLWAGPFLLIAGGAAAFAMVVRRRRAHAPQAQMPAPRRKELEALLEDGKD
jgi:cytochrome c-type biogenesis protein CcmH